MITNYDERENLIIDFTEDEDWDSFAKIGDFLENKIKAHIKEKLDGPESRVWVFSIDDNEFSLHNNPYGNYLKATTTRSKKMLIDLIPQLSSNFT